jgi:hypothetical protein
MILRWPIAAVLGLLPVAAVVAWSTQVHSHELSAADKYRKQVGAICQSNAAALAALPDPARPSDVGPWARRGEQIAEMELTQVRALAVPAELQPGVTRVLAAEDRSGRAMRRFLPELDRVRTKAQLRAVVRTAGRMEQRYSTDAQWRALGVTACAQ